MRKLKLLPIVLALLPLTFNSCSSTSDSGLIGANSPANIQPDFSKLKASCFIPEVSNPILKMGSLIAGSNWNDPHVIKVKNQFVMYASADTNFSKDIKIYRLISSDGKNWSLSPSHAVFEKSQDSNAWDRQSVETPAVVFFKNQYYMFYTGYSNQTDSSTYNIGFATSPDGIVWTRQSPRLMPTNPKGAPDLNFMQFVVGEPAPVVFNNKIYLYFTAEGAHLDLNNTQFTLGLITTDDGLNWSTPQEVLRPNQTIYPRNTWIGYSTPHAANINNQIHLFFDVARDPFIQEKIHHATSNDGISGWNLDSTSIFDKTRFSWADDQINGPAVLLDGTNLYLWFGGQGNISSFPNISMGIGMAICPL